MEESPPYSRRKSGHDSRNGFVYRNNLAVTQSQGESPYEIKSGRGLVKTDGSFAALIVSVLTPTLGPWDIVTRRNGVIIIVIGHNIAPANDIQQAVPRGYRQKVAGQGASVICLQY